MSWLADMGCLMDQEAATQVPNPALVRRYKALRTVNFGESVTLEQRKWFLQQLVPVCNNLAVE